MFFRSLTALHGQVADLLVVRVVLKVHGARQQEGQPGKRGKQCAKITAFFPVQRGLRNVIVLLFLLVIIIVVVVVNEN